MNYLPKLRNFFTLISELFKRIYNIHQKIVTISPNGNIAIFYSSHTLDVTGEL